MAGGMASGVPKKEKTRILTVFSFFTIGCDL
jgi:hypothetical protein